MFVVCSFAADQAVKCVSAKANDTCRADIAKNMVAQADQQSKPESPSYILVGDARVKAAVPPVSVTPKVLGAIVGDAQDYRDEIGDRKDIVEYEVQSGDTVASLAEKFGISTDTIVWANDMKKGETVKPGQQLIIPPVTGVVHYVVPGDTLAKIASNYKSDSQKIVAFNELAGEDSVFVGDVLIVPEGRMPQVVVPAKPLAQATGGASLSGNYFLCPVGSPCRKTQGAHFRNAVDLTAGYCGAPIYAAASGVVSKAVTGGWNGGAGNNISLSHLGGTVITHYYHLQTVLVSQGREVKKGDVIGLMGTTGKSTGCHLHFEIIGAANPFR